MPGTTTDPRPGIIRTATASAGITVPGTTWTVTDSAGITVPGITRTATVTYSRTATDYLGLLWAGPVLGLGILTIRVDIQH